MKLTSLSASDLIAAFRSPQPTPGGGSASALAGAAGAALLSMVAALPKNRTASEEEIDRLRAAGARCTMVSDALLDLVDRDSEAYQLLIAAYRLPKDSDAEKSERKSRIQAAMRGAAETPLDTMRWAAEALESAATVARLGNANAASDVEVALQLLTAAQLGAAANVEVNLASISDPAYAEQLQQETVRVGEQCAAALAAARRAGRAD